jgi:hypothetical protein
MDNKNVRGYIEFIYDFYKSMKAHEISLVYEGEITHQITKAFTTMAETNMLKGEESNSVQKKVFHVMVECLQNISKHADVPRFENDVFASRGLFMVSKGDNNYHVTTGNIVENDKIEELTTMLDHINSLDKDGLKALHKEQMQKGSLSEKGGAGLGFIDIARKTGNKLDYHLLPVDGLTHFFVLTSTITRD